LEAECYVIFGSTFADKDTWWSVFTSPKWTHVVLVEELQWSGVSLMDTRLTLVSEYARGQIHTAVYPCSARRYVDTLHYSGVVAAAVRFDKRLAKRNGIEYIPTRMLTCVEFVKSHLGVFGWFVWTPKQLFTHLKNLGGEVIWDLEVRNQKAQLRQK
jgi:hypothetical protein